MVGSLEHAMAEVATLPEETQQDIARQILEHVEKLRRLRADLDEARRSLDAGEGSELDIEDVIQEARRRHGDVSS